MAQIASTLASVDATNLGYPTPTSWSDLLMRPSNFGLVNSGIKRYTKRDPITFSRQQTDSTLAQVVYTIPPEGFLDGENSGFYFNVKVQKTHPDYLAGVQTRGYHGPYGCVKSKIEFLSSVGILGCIKKVVITKAGEVIQENEMYAELQQIEHTKITPDVAMYEQSFMTKSNKDYGVSWTPKLMKDGVLDNPIVPNGAFTKSLWHNYPYTSDGTANDYLPDGHVMKRYTNPVTQLSGSIVNNFDHPAFVSLRSISDLFSIPLPMFAYEKGGSYTITLDLDFTRIQRYQVRQYSATPSTLTSFKQTLINNVEMMYPTFDVYVTRDTLFMDQQVMVSISDRLSKGELGPSLNVFNYTNQATITTVKQEGTTQLSTYMPCSGRFIQAFIVRCPYPMVGAPPQQQGYGVLTSNFPDNLTWNIVINNKVIFEYGAIDNFEDAYDVTTEALGKLHLSPGEYTNKNNILYLPDDNAIYSLDRCQRFLATALQRTCDYSNAIINFTNLPNEARNIYVMCIFNSQVILNSQLPIIVQN